MNERDVRDALREIFAERGFNHSAIARKAGLTPAKLWATLNKTRKMEANELMAICKAGQIELNDLMTRCKAS